MIQEGKSDFKLQLKNRICDWSVTSVLFVKRVSAINNEIFVDPILKQFVRASTSVGANYVEAIASPTIKDFRNFLANSLKSCNEAIYWLELDRKSVV